MFTSLKFRMNAGFMSIIFVSVLLVGLAASMYSAKESLRNFESHARRQMSTLAAMTEFFYDEVRNDIDQLAGSPVLGGADPDMRRYALSGKGSEPPFSGSGGAEREIYELFEHYAMYHPGTLRVCMATEDAGYVQWPEADVAEDFDPRTQRWYAKGMRAAGRVVEMEPYLELSTGEIVVRLVRSFKNMDGASHGVAAIDISMRRLAILLSRKVIGESGRVMMIHTSGIALTDLAFPESDLKNVSELGIEGFERMFGPNALFSATIDGETHILSSVRSDATGWIFAAVAREKDVLSATRAIQKMLLLISIGVGLVSVILIIVFSSVLTEIVRTQEAHIRESEMRHRIIFEKSPLGMIRFSDDGEIMDCNDKFVELMGSTREKLMGFNTARRSSPEMREKIRVALEGEPSVYENEYTSVNGGRTLYLRVVFNPIEPGTNPTGVIATLEDITEAKKAEAALRESEMRHRVIFEKSPLGLARFDREGVITDCNQRYMEIMGATRETLIGFDALRRSTPEMCERIGAALAGEPSVYEGEFTSVTGGRTFFMRAAFNPLESGRRSSGVIATVEDITERKMIEREVRANLEELERFSRLVVGREERMIQLKREVNDFLVARGDAPKYKIVE